MNYKLPSIENEQANPDLEPYVEGFLNDRFSESNDLRKCLISGNLEEARKLAHNWKGFCGPYGFLGLGILSEALERSAAVNNVSECQQLAAQIELYLVHKKRYLDL